MYFSEMACFIAGRRPTPNGYCCFRRHRHSFRRHSFRHSNDCCFRQNCYRCYNFRSNVYCYRRYSCSNDCFRPNSCHLTSDCSRSCRSDCCPNNSPPCCRACSSLDRPSKHRNCEWYVWYAYCCCGLSCPNTDHNPSGCCPMNGYCRNCPSGCCLHTHPPSVRNDLNDSASSNSGPTGRCYALMNFGRKSTCLRMTKNAMRRSRHVRKKKYGSWLSDCCLPSSGHAHSLAPPNCNSCLCNTDSKGSDSSSSSHRNTLRTTDHTTDRTSRHKNRPNPSRSSSPNKDVSIATNKASSKTTDHTTNTSYPIRCRCSHGYSHWIPRWNNRCRIRRNNSRHSDSVPHYLLRQW